MNPMQFSEFIEVLERLLARQYTITGAADWPLLLTIGGVLGAVLMMLIAIIGFMWRDIRAVVKDNRGEWREELMRLEAKNEDAHKDLWDELKTKKGIAGC